MISDAVLREIVILEERLWQAKKALLTLGSLLRLDVRAGSVSAMRTSLRDPSASSDPGAQPPLPF